MLGHDKLSIICLTAFVVLAGCSAGPDFVTPQAPQVSSFTRSPLPLEIVKLAGQEEKTQKFVHKNSVIPQWWTLFQCQSLNDLVQAGLDHSPTLQAAKASLHQAIENLNVERGGFFPAIDGQAGANRQRTSSASFGVPGNPYRYNLYDLSLNLSYNIDIFGALRRKVEALGAQVDYQQFELEAAHLSLTTALVNAAIQEASLRSRIQITHDLLESQEKQLHILKLQLKLGSIAMADVLAQQTLVAQTKASLPPLTKGLAQIRNSMAVLAGQFPGEAVLPCFTFDNLHLPEELPVVVPSTLVRHRPDVKAAEALLHQASAEIGVAKANMFPQISLTGNVGSVSNKAGSLLTSSSSVWGIGSQLLQPLFRGGSQIAMEDAAYAAYDVSFAQYRQTVLEAFQQVADVLEALVEDAKAHKAQEAAEEFARKTVEISRSQYKLGSISFLNVLVAELQHQETQLNLIEAQTARYTNTVTLYKALGGGRQSLESAGKDSSSVQNIQEIKP